MAGLDLLFHPPATIKDRRELLPDIKSDTSLRRIPVIILSDDEREERRKREVGVPLEGNRR